MEQLSDFIGWTPSLRSNGLPDVPPAPLDDEPNDLPWRCAKCDAVDYVNSMDGWTCNRCGSLEFYNPMVPMKSVTMSGTWMYMPHNQPEQPEGSTSSATPKSSSASRRRRRRLRVAAGMPESGDGGVASEFGESEAPTHDSCVDPSNQSSRRHPEPQVPDLRPVPQAPRVQPGSVPPSVPRQATAALNSPGNSDRRVGTADWNSRMGPEPNVRWKSGAPPIPPVWRYEGSDLRAFDKFSKKVRIWEIQMEPYAPKKDQALMLYNSLSGEAEQELEHVTISEIHHEDGINVILQKLQTPFQQRAVFQKRKFLHEYESLRRFNGELIRTYIQRFRRSIRNLRAVGVDVTATYDTEALGSRLLDRSGLTVEAQRLVLVGTSQRLDLEVIAEALTLQYPDFRGAPPLAFRDGKGAGKGDRTQSSMPSSSSSRSFSSSSGKGTTSTRTSSAASKTAFVAEAADSLDAIKEQDAELPEEDQEPEINEESEELLADDAENEEESDNVDLNELSQVLTVTARRLAGLTLGRKFTTRKPDSNNAASNIAKRKMTSHCSACGEKGHWKDDDICPMKNKGAVKKTEFRPPAKNTGYRAQTAQKQKAQQAFPVVHHEHGHFEIHDHPDEEFGNAFVCNMVNNPSFHVHEVQAFSPTEFVGKMILDSACQRTCCGLSWFEAHAQQLQQLRLQHKEVRTKDVFQFGLGEPTSAIHRAYLLSSIGGKPMLLATAVLDANIPLLGSNKLLERLHAVIDMGKGIVCFSTIGVEVPLVKIGGHYAINILDFPHQEPHTLSCWKSFSHPAFWKTPDPELILTSSTSSASTTQRAEPVSTSIRSESHAPSSAMVGELAGTHDSGVDLSTSCTEPGIPTSLDDRARGVGHGRVQAQEHKAVRQCAWQFRKVPSVQRSVQVEPSSRGMGLHGFIAILTIALTMLREHSSGGPQEPSNDFLQQFIKVGSERQIEGHAKSTSLYYDFLDLYQGAARGTDAPSSSTSSARAGSELKPSGRGDDGRRCEGELRKLLPAGASPRPGHNAGQRADGPSTSPSRPTAGSGSGQQRGGHRVQMGAVKKIRGTLKRAIQVYETELKIYNNTNSVADRPPPHIDIFELFSGTSKFTTRSIKHQLNALAPMDIEHGPHQDFKDEAVRKEVFRLLKKFKPWLTALGIDCRLWSIFSENLNFSQDPQLLQQLRELELPLVLFAAEVAMHQMDHHRFFLIENPVRSRLWTLPVMIQLLQQPGVWSTVLDTGAWGAEIDGQMIIKPMRFVGNLPGLDEVIHKRLSEHERQWCQPIQGTKKSQEYPDALVDAILKHLRKAIQQMEPFRFNINLVYAVA